VKRPQRLGCPDDDNKVVGVVSGYDILALDCTPGRMKGDNELFPSVDM
jgi:hypothetical protein